MKRNKLLTAANAAIIAYYMVFFLWAKLSEPDEGETFGPISTRDEKGQV